MKIGPLMMALALGAGCTKAAPPSEKAPPPSAPATVSPAAQPDAMDARKPVPLLPMMANHQKEQMRGHLEAVQEVVAALAIDDLAAVEKAAARMGYTEQMGMMCNHMGAAAPGFTPLALQFHHSADAIVLAAHRRDRKGVEAALGSTLALCTSCHATYKQEIVDEATWSALAGRPPPHHGP